MVMTGETPRSSVGERPTLVRHAVLFVTTVMAVLLYLDRFAVGIAKEYIREDLGMTQAQMSWFIGAFFWSYAICQVPAGWFSDRYGARRMLTFYILAWSAFTGFLGITHLVWMVLALRLLCGAAQAGAYPTAGGMIRVWFPISGRGVASAIVALGGRAGGVLAPLLTAWLIVMFSREADPASFNRSSIVNEQSFLKAFHTRAESPRAPVVERLLSRLPDTLRRDVVSHAATLVQSAELGGTQPVPGYQHDWYDGLLVQFAMQLKQPDLFTGVDVTRLKLVPEAVVLLQQKEQVQQQQDQQHATSGPQLTDADAMRLNRLVVEAAFPGSVKQFRGAGWRPTMIMYGLLGLVAAVGFFMVTRDLPRLHPWCNAAECDLIDDELTRTLRAAEPRDPPFPCRAIVTNLGLWGNSLMQAFTNIGWLFVVMWLPQYLGEVHGVPLKWQAIMTAIPTAAGIVGMYLGGWWTDLATHYSGRKWGRRLPVLVTRFSAGLGYGICVVLSLCVQPDPSRAWLPWAYVAALCLMAFSVDMGNPAVWGYAQDVGGKYTGSVLGWANMWGNLGAAIAPQIYNAVLGEKPAAFQWTLMFGVCLLAFVLSALCSLVMDSTKPLDPLAESMRSED